MTLVSGITNVSFGSFAAERCLNISPPDAPQQRTSGPSHLCCHSPDRGMSQLWTIPKSGRSRSLWRTVVQETSACLQLRNKAQAEIESAPYVSDMARLGSLPFDKPSLLSPRKRNWKTGASSVAPGTVMTRVPNLRASSSNVRVGNKAAVC